MMKMIVMMIMVMMMLMMILLSMMMHVYNGNYDDDDANYCISIRIHLTVYPIQRCHQHSDETVVVSFVKLLRKNP
jgi:hypothetical protein